VLNEEIAKLRKLKNISQVELANALGVTKQCISNWENDNVQPSVEMLMKLSNYFSVSTDCLLGLDNRKYLEITNLDDIRLMHIQQIINDITVK
jgi:transcriptional regulator with XRE-family HTH domain